MPLSRRIATATGAAIALASLAGPAAAQGEAVDITYGYHPYWTGGWNGVIIKEQELWKEHLPEGSTVEFESHLTGPPMVNALIADNMQIGTMGDMPSLVATAKRGQADIRLVSVPMMSPGYNCNNVVVNDDAPDFGSVEEATDWLDGRRVVVHRGTCANRFIEAVVAKGAFEPSKIDNQTIEVIASNLEADNIDAAAMWEPHARRAVAQGHAKYALTGAPWDEWDANFSLMRQDFIEEHPEAAKGWLKAEIEAVRFMIENPDQTAEIMGRVLSGYDKETAWQALYARKAEATGASPINYQGKMVFDDDVRDLMEAGYSFLNEMRVIRSGAVPDQAVNDAPLKAALDELGMEAPIGEIRGQ